MMPRPVAKMPPDEVPQIMSNDSDTRMPTVFSSARTISIVASPRIPPPSIARIRTPRRAADGLRSAWSTNTWAWRE